MRSTRHLLLASTFFVGLATASAAAAQPADQPPPPKPAAAPADEGSSVSELVVTGSHIKSNEFTSSSPITVVTNEQAALEGTVDTATLLQEQPIASGSFQVNGQLTGYVTSGGPGAATISLRGLGAQRTLVLLDGKRLGPAGVRGQVGPVDLNVIPDAILDRVEILKDGASSIYGSDAVAGVVNFITRTNLDRPQISIYGSLPGHHGGEQFEVNGAWGKVFDRGYFNVTVDFTKQYELKNKDRTYTSCGEGFVFTPGTTNRADYIDPTTGKYKCYNLFGNSFEDADGVYGGVFQYGVPGITYPDAAHGNNIATISPNLAALGFVRAARAGQPQTWPYANYTSPLYDNASAINGYERYTAYLAGGYDLTPTTELYANLLFNQRKSTLHGWQQLFTTLFAGNPNNTAIFADGWHDVIPIVPQELNQWQRVNYVRGVLGLKGKFNGGFLNNWNWEVYGQVSHSDARYTTTFAYADRIFATILPGTACDQSQITFSGGQCSSIPGGIPWLSQHFLAGQFTTAERNFLFGTATGNTEYDQELIEATVSGSAFNLPAGPVQFAFGVSGRREHIDDTPSDEEQNQNMYNLSAAQRTTGTDNIWEIYGESHIPLIKGATLFENLEAEISGRYTHYESYGGNGTYKLGLNWQIIPSVRLRGTYGTSFRAPALYELFLGDQTSFLGQTSVDPCIHPELITNSTLQANCHAAGVPDGYAGGGSGVTIFTGGGIGNLKAETSRAGTVGIIFTPSIVNFSLAVDYFDIDVKNEVRQFGPGNIVTQCYRSQQYPTDPFCGLFTRDPTTHGIVLVHDNYVNVAEEHNRGIDVTLRYQQNLPWDTKLTVDSVLTWQFEDVTQLLGASVPENFNGSTTEPDFTGTIQFRFDRHDWTFLWKVEMYGKASDSDLSGFNFTDVHLSGKYAPQGSASTPIYYKQYTEFTAYHTISLRRRLDNWTAEIGIENLFDEPPPALSENEGFRTGNAALNAYDLIGRRVFIRLDHKF